MNPGKLYLIPTPLGDTEPAACLPQSVLETACGLHCFVVEELRTARRFLSRYGLRGHIDELDLHELNEHTTPAEVEALLPLFDGQDVGLMSEAGLPAVADPGAALVAASLSPSAATSPPRPTSAVRRSRSWRSSPAA